MSSLLLNKNKIDDLGRGVESEIFKVEIFEGKWGLSMPSNPNHKTNSSILVHRMKCEGIARLFQVSVHETHVFLAINGMAHPFDALKKSNINTGIFFQIKIQKLYSVKGITVIPLILHL